MGAGSFAAGIGPAGFDPLVVTPADTSELPAGVFYDPALRAFPFDEGGRLEVVHPVDQIVALVVTTPLGSLAASPDVGVDLGRIRRAQPSARQATITDCVRYALRDVIAAGDVEFLGAPILETDPDGTLWAVDYVNLRLPGQPARRFEPGV